MGWSIGYDSHWKRDIGYGVPAECDHPDCKSEINRGLGCVCGSDPYGGEHGCGLYFCDKHLMYGQAYKQLCERCVVFNEPFDPKPDVEEWINHKMTDPSWAKWREKNMTAAQEK